VSYVCAGKSFPSIEAASAHAQKIFASKGIVVAIEEKKKLSKKMIEARIQRAVVGFRIPMLAIPKLGARLEHAVKSEMSDEYLKEVVAGWPGVEVA
jgi:hypothetical protein